MNKRVWPEDRDLTHAHALLMGFSGSRISKTNNKKPRFPSSTTTPTEKECREALARVLMRKSPPLDLLWELADLFDPNSDRHHYLGARRRVVFQNLSQGAKDEERKFDIAVRIHGLRKKLGPTQGIEAAAAEAGIEVRYAQKVYAEYRKVLQELEVFHETASDDVS